MTSKPTIPVIALDGPAGAGKGTVGRALAARFGWHYLDSGALYRIAAVAALRSGWDQTQIEQIAAAIPALDIKFVDDAIWLAGANVSQAIRSEKAGAMASSIATAPTVREALTSRQRAFRQPPGLVADGRDMATVVFADAFVKVFLTASPEERARRRYKQLKEQGIDVKLPRLESELRARDAQDARRETAPLKMAADALLLNTDGHSATWAVEQIVTQAKNVAQRQGLSLDFKS